MTNVTLDIDTSVRDFIWLQTKLPGSLLMEWLYDLRVWLKVIPENKKGGDVMIKPGKGKDGYRDGHIIFFDADGKIIDVWPKRPAESKNESLEEVL